MELIDLLLSGREEAVDEALQALARAALPHYSVSQAEQNRDRLAKLYELTVECVRTRSLLPMIDYSRRVARDRFRDGFGLHEVHTAFNVLEEVIWRRIAKEMEPSGFPRAFGLASTVLGAGKEALAIEYVGLAGHSGEVPSLDLSALFRGTT